MSLANQMTVFVAPVYDLELHLITVCMTLIRIELKFVNAAEAAVSCDKLSIQARDIAYIHISYISKVRRWLRHHSDSQHDLIQAQDYNMLRMR